MSSIRSSHHSTMAAAIATVLVAALVCAQEPGTQSAVPRTAPGVKVGRQYGTPGTVRRIAITIHGKQEIITTVDSEDSAYVLVLPPLVPTSLRIGQNKTWVTLNEEADDFSTLGLQPDAPVLLELDVRDGFSDPVYFSELMKAAVAAKPAAPQSSAQEAIPAELTGPVKASLLYVDKGEEVILGTTIVERGLNAQARIRFTIAGEQAGRLLTMRKSDLLLKITLATPGSFSETHAKVTGAHFSEYLAELKHAIDTLPADREVVLIPIGESAETGTSTNVTIRDVLRLRIEFATGAKRADAEYLVDRVLAHFLSQVNADNLTGNDLVVFNCKHNVPFITLDEIKQLSDDRLSQFERTEATSNERAESEKKAVNLFGVISGEKASSEFEKAERVEIVKRLRHLKQDLQGTLHTLPAFSLSSLKNASTKSKETIIAEIGQITAAEIPVHADFRLVATHWVASPPFEAGWRIVHNGQLALLTVSQDGRSLMLFDENDNMSQGTPDQEGWFTAFGVLARYVETTGEIAWYGNGKESAPTGMWLSHRSTPSPSAQFHNGGRGEQKTILTLTSKGVQIQDEHSRTAIAEFDPRNPRTGTAWGIPFEIRTSHMIKWPANFWSYHSGDRPFEPHWFSFISDLEKAK